MQLSKPHFPPETPRKEFFNSDALLTTITVREACPETDGWFHAGTVAYGCVGHCRVYLVDFGGRYLREANGARVASSRMLVVVRWSGGEASK